MSEKTTTRPFSVLALSSVLLVFVPLSQGFTLQNGVGVAVPERKLASRLDAGKGDDARCGGGAEVSRREGLKTAAKLTAALLGLQSASPSKADAIDLPVEMSTPLGVEKDLLKSCPKEPTCVSTQDDRPYNFMEPWAYDSSTEKTLASLKALVYAQGATFVTEADRYLRVQFEASGGGGLDDVEFYFTPNDRIIQFRANRRSGFTDFGTNRKRMDKIRIALGLESVPVLRNRKRAFFFGESPLDGFGPSGFTDLAEEFPEGAYGDLDPAAPVFETPAKQLKKDQHGWWATSTSLN